MKTLEQIGDQAYHLLPNARVEKALLDAGWEYYEDRDFWEMFEGSRTAYEDWMDDQIYMFDDSEGKHWYYSHGRKWR